MDESGLTPEQEREIERLENGGVADEEHGYEKVDLHVKKPLGAAMLVRIDRETYAALGKLARGQGIGPATLVRMWILEKLKNAPVEANR